MVVMEIAHLATTIANIGFAIVVGWYLLTKGIPDMQRRFDESLKMQREAFQESVKQKRDDYKADIKEIRQDAKDSLNSVLAHCITENQRRDETMRIEMSSMTKAVEDVGSIMEDIRGLLLRAHEGNK